MKASGTAWNAEEHARLVEAGFGATEARLLALAMGLSVADTSDIRRPEGEFYSCPELLASAQHLDAQELAFMMWGVDQSFRKEEYVCLAPLGDEYRATAIAEHHTLCP